METDGVWFSLLGWPGRRCNNPRAACMIQRNTGLAPKVFWLLSLLFLSVPEQSTAFLTPPPLAQFCRVPMMSPLAHDVGERELQLTVNAYSGLIRAPLHLHLSSREPARQGRPGQVRAALLKQHSEASGRVQGVSPGPDPFSRCCGPKCGRPGGLDLGASQQGAGVHLLHPSPTPHPPSAPEALPTCLDLPWGASFPNVLPLHKSFCSLSAQRLTDPMGSGQQKQ